LNHLGEPVSILDIQEEQVQVDAQGNPKYIMLNRPGQGSGDGDQ
jgi:hypothetical protein